MKDPEKAQKYHLGFTTDIAHGNGRPEDLTLFKTAAEADRECCEWVTVEANSEAEAREKYEAAFDAWQRKNEEEAYLDQGHLHT